MQIEAVLFRLHVWKAMRTVWNIPAMHCLDVVVVTGYTMTGSPCKTVIWSPLFLFLVFRFVSLWNTIRQLYLTASGKRLLIQGLFYSWGTLNTWTIIHLPILQYHLYTHGSILNETVPTYTELFAVSFRAIFIPL